MTKKLAENTKEDIIKCALEISAKDGWEFVSLEGVAKGIGVSLEDVRIYFINKDDILSALDQMIDAQVQKNIGDDGADDGVTPRDMLFDVLMERFEVLNEYRGGIISILDAMCPDYSQGVVLLPHLASSMRKMLELSGSKVIGARGAIKIVGLTGIYLKVLRDWKKDEGADLSKTMASLDNALGYADRAVSYFGI